MKLMFRKKFILSIMALVVASASLMAQSATTGTDSGYSPYSIYGMGDLFQQGTAYTNSMGGVGVATRNKRFLNYTNPASITCRDTLSFMMEFGVEQANRYFAQGYGIERATSVNNTFNISNIAFSFPIYRSLTMAVGFTPYSTMGYDYRSQEGSLDYIANAGTINKVIKGDGSVNSLFLDIAGSLFKKSLSLGAEFDFLFGKLDRSTTIGFTRTEYSMLNMGYESVVRAFRAKLGVQYEARISPQHSLILGSTFAFPSVTGGQTEDYKYTITSSADYYDTLSTNTVYHNKIRTAMEATGGIAYHFSDKLAVEVNYIWQDGSKTGFDEFQPFAVVGDVNFKGAQAHSIRAGFDYVPNRNDIRYYYKRISYKGGVYYNQAPYTVNDRRVQSYGLTFGVTLPVVRWFNGLTLGVDLGRTSCAAPGTVNTNYVKFNVGINIHDYWFQKSQYN